VHSLRPRTYSIKLRAAGLLLLACLLAPLAGMTAADAVTGDNVGLSGGHMLLWESEHDRQADLNAIQLSGAKWVAVDVDWASIEYQNNQYRWGPLDNVVLAAKARGLKVLGIIAYTPKWARPADCPPNNTHCLPQKAEQFAAFAADAASRYGNFSGYPNLRSGITSWQIWNEPNHYPFVQRVDIPLYVNMLKQSYTSIKQRDPYTWVLAGGTAPAPDDPGGKDMSPATFLSSIYFWGARGYFDAFGHHPYSFPCSPLTEAPWNAFYQTLALHWIMVYNGDGAKRIWGTEAGAPTGADVGGCTANAGKSVTETTQSQYAAQYILRWTKDWGAFTGPLFWFQVRDNGTNVWNWNDNLGLLRRNFTAKPAYDVFRLLNSM
jgi:polysaccharide biosynthesis protein PslG